MKTIHPDNRITNGHYSSGQYNKSIKVDPCSVEAKEKKAFTTSVSWEKEALESSQDSSNSTLHDLLNGKVDLKKLRSELGAETYNRYLKTLDQYTDGIAKPIKIDEFI